MIIVAICFIKINKLQGEKAILKTEIYAEKNLHEYTKNALNIYQEMFRDERGYGHK